MTLEETTMKFRLRVIATATVLACPAVHAVEIDTGDDALKLRLDMTPKYSLGYRLRNPMAALVQPTAQDPGIVNENDGDANFHKGLVSNRLDLLVEFDANTPDKGLRLSGTGWYDQAYRRRNDNDGSTGVNNFPNQAPDEFLPATRRQHGADAQLLDAFVYFKGDVGNMRGTVRLGKHTLQFGESLIFGQNGIANAQGPVDIAKAVAVPGWQFKEILLPVEQVSGTLQIAPGLSAAAYYQVKWRPSKIPGVGSFFSNQDYVGTGQAGFGLLYDASHDIKPKDSGQGGIALRWTPADSGFDFGFYAARYHDKTPAVPVYDFNRGYQHLVYAEGIKTFGASVTSSVGQLNWAIEASMRVDAPLSADPAVLGGPSPVSNCDNHKATACYPIGDTAHLLASGIYVLPPSMLWQGGVLLGEIAWNRTLKTKYVGVGNADPNTTRDAWAMRLIFEPQYFQVAPQLDVSLPTSVGYNFGGRSSAVFNFAGGAAKAGDYSFGVKLKYLAVWSASLVYADYFGKATTFTNTLVSGAPAPRQLSYGQSLRDRRNVSLSVQRTF